MQENVSRALCQHKRIQGGKHSHTIYHPLRHYEYICLCESALHSVYLAYMTLCRLFQVI